MTCFASLFTTYFFRCLRKVSLSQPYKTWVFRDSNKRCRGTLEITAMYLHHYVSICINPNPLRCKFSPNIIDWVQVFKSTSNLSCKESGLLSQFCEKENHEIQVYLSTELSYSCQVIKHLSSMGIFADCIHLASVFILKSVWTSQQDLTTKIVPKTKCKWVPETGVSKSSMLQVLCSVNSSSLTIYLSINPFAFCTFIMYIFWLSFLLTLNSFSP